MARLIRWYIVEDVTVSSEGATPEYRVAAADDVAPFPAAWLTGRTAFESRDAAVAALTNLRAGLDPVAPAQTARASRRASARRTGR